jgi:ABC-type multidrug transport system fused ATPase/permease subunit
LNQLFLHLKYCRQLFSILGFSRLSAVGVILVYYLFTLSSALLDGIGLLYLVALFTGGDTSVLERAVPKALLETLPIPNQNANSTNILTFVICVYFFNVLIRFGLLLFDAWIAAYLRRRLQEKVFERYIYCDWSFMRAIRIGSAVGTTAQETILVTKYITCLIASGYFALSALVIAILAAATSLKIFLLFILIIAPLALGMKYVIGRQARFSVKSSELRNLFSADLTDRLNGLLQIRVEENPKYHLDKGLRIQPSLTRLEILIGYCGALIGVFNLLMPLVCLIALYVWQNFWPEQGAGGMALAASIGILGIRFANQLNGAVVSAGSVVRLSGSFYPVLQALELPPIRQVQQVPEAIGTVQLTDVAFSYGDCVVLSEVNLTIERGIPIILVAPSGRGKTTLAHLISGLYLPEKGSIEYIGDESKKVYGSYGYRARVGYVTQDIYLFQGSLRENLQSDRAIPDLQIWSVLEMVGAADFVAALGGLDAESSEAGRSLSGGQRRRLGIARVLLLDCEILILDEITAGLDQENQQSVLEILRKLSESHLMVLISHQPLNLPNQKIYEL